MNTRSFGLYYPNQRLWLTETGEWAGLYSEEMKDDKPLALTAKAARSRAGTGPDPDINYVVHGPSGHRVQARMLPPIFWS